MESNNTYNITSLMQTSSAVLPQLLILFLVLQQIVFIVACSGNLFVIYIITRHMRFKDKSNIFILNLALSDFFSGISAGGQILYVFFPQLSVYTITCMLRYQIVGAMTLASQCTVFIVAVDRYLAICHQCTYDKLISKRAVIFLAFLPWILSLSISCAPFFGWNLMSIYKKCSYSLLFPSEFYWTIALVVTVLSVASLTVHSFIFYAIRKLRRRVHPNNEISNDDRRLQKRIRGAKLMMIITIVFSVCWLPYMAFPFSYALGHRKNTNLNEASSWLVFLGMLNCVINPCIYVWYKRDFRQACKKACYCAELPAQSN